MTENIHHTLAPIVFTAFDISGLKNCSCLPEDSLPEDFISWQGTFLW